MRCEIVRLLESDSELTSVYLSQIELDYAKLLHRRFDPKPHVDFCLITLLVGR